ncbi:LuxR family transcriptional regulator [Amycolatopsis ultiminotia]|uniref:LuxR family transcriptional regulator n=1 Tax=Amycolatopsis ultiminotia TaxID=543629 RepID=A0ABP6W0U7_9PSEU
MAGPDVASGPRTTGAADRPVRSAAEADLVERSEQLSALTRVLDEGLAGAGRLAVVEGPAGIGKTRLLGEVRHLLGTRDVDVLDACGGELEQGYALGLVLRLLERRLAQAAEEERVGIFRGQARLLAEIFTGTRGEGSAELNDEFALVHGLYWLMVNLSERRPVVMIVDDAQWADAPSLRFLAYLAQRLRGLPVVLLMAVRSGEPASDGPEISRMLLQADVSVTLQGLTVDGVRAVLSATLPPKTLPPDTDLDVLARDTWSATRGNPFMVHELAAAARNGERSATAVGAAPASVARATMLRISALGEAAVAMARAVAVLGGSATLTTSAHVAGLSHEEALRAAEQLAAVEIFTAGPEPAFHHPLTYSAVYSKIAADQRARAHLDAARLLHDSRADPEDVALHLMRSIPVTDRWSQTVLRAAARRAASKGAPGAAVGFLRRALEWSGDDDVDAGLLIELGTMEAAAGETDSVRHLERAHLIAQPHDRAGARYALAQTLFRYGRPAEAFTVFRRGADEFADHDRDLRLRFVAGCLASAAYQLTEIHRGDAVALGQRLAAEFDGAAQSTPAERLLMLHLALFRAMSEPDPKVVEQTVVALGDSVQLWRDTSDGMALSHAVLTLTWCAAPSEAVVVADTVLAEARRRGDALVFAEVSLTRGLAMYARGRVSDAMADAQAAVTGMSRGWNATVPAPQGLLAYCHLDRGETDEAGRVLTMAEPYLRDTNGSGLNVWFYLARGRLALARQDLHRAQDDFRLVGRLLEAHGFGNPGFALVSWRSLAALAAHELGQVDEADRLVQREIELATRLGLPTVLGVALRCRALIAPGGVDLELLRRSAEVLDHREASQLELAASLMELGSAMRRAGRRRECRDVLKRALALAHQAGALAVEARVHAELLAAGARPRRPMIDGPAALTPSERRIADLLAEGVTARQVAESLYLTINTVEWHRRNVYRKLGVTSREALADALTASADDVSR